MDVYRERERERYRGTCAHKVLAEIRWYLMKIEIGIGQFHVLKCIIHSNAAYLVLNGKNLTTISNCGA